MMLFILELFPKFLAKEAYEAREVMTRFLERYFYAEGYKTGS